MGFFQSLKDDLSSAMNELIGDNEELEDDAPVLPGDDNLFPDGEPLLSNTDSEEEEKASAAAARKQEAAAKVRVSTSYHLEDRYVIGKVELPDVIGTQAGKITVNIFVNHSGTVKKTSIADGATITDPDVTEAVRRAALKTDFNSDYDAQDMAPGTITYTFVKK